MPDPLLPPRFETVEATRQHRQQRLAAALRVFAQFGFDAGVAGHITARDPEFPDHFWVNPFARHFSRIRVSDLLLVNAEGEVVKGDRPVNRAAFAIHSQIHAARPDVVAAAHAHATHGMAWSTLGRPLDPITQDACAFYQDHVVFESFAGVVLDTGYGKRIAMELGSAKAIILQNHGLLTVGQSVDEAAWWFISMNQCCQAQFLAESVGKPRPIEAEVAQLTYQQIGGHDAGWLSFQPLYEQIIAQQPDLLE